MMPAVESIRPFIFLLVISAKPLLFAINFYAVAFELRPVPCYFGARNALSLLVLPVATAADLRL